MVSKKAKEKWEYGGQKKINESGWYLAQRCKRCYKKQNEGVRVGTKWRTLEGGDNKLNTNVPAEGLTAGKEAREVIEAFT